jgi:uncharacterized membrane protein SirB2
VSLKAFHIVFISLSVLTLLGFAAWFALSEAVEAGVVRVLGALLSLLSGIALFLYGRRFVRKFKHFSNL